MITRLTRQCVEHRWIVLLLAALATVAGLHAYRHATIEVHPDISAPQVLVISHCPGRPAREIEQRVTIPIELAVSNAQHVAAIRSHTIFGLSVVEVVFQEQVELHSARHRVRDLLDPVELPAGIKPILGPLATPYGEIYRYELQSDGSRDLMELRTLNEWVVSPLVERVPGVTRLINFGGYDQQYTVQLDPRRLERHGFSLTDVVEAIRSSNASGGASLITRGDLDFTVRGRGQLRSLEELESAVVDTVAGVPVYVRDVAQVSIEPRRPAGVFGKDDVAEGVEGIVLMGRGENAPATLAALRAQIAQINREVLPAGVRIVPFYDRQELIDQVWTTVSHSVRFGMALALLVLLLFLGEPLMTLLVALTIPFSLLVALVPLHLAGEPIRLLSIGTIDFGLLVAGSAVLADQIAHRWRVAGGGVDLPGSTSALRRQIAGAADRVDNAVMWSMLAVMLAHLPILSLSGLEGLLFRPTIWTVLLAMLAGAAYGLLVLPALVSLVYPRGYQDWENPLVAWCRPWYARLLRRLIEWRAPVAMLFLSAVVGSGWWILPRVPTELTTYVDEGVIWIRGALPAGTSLERTSAVATRLRAILREFPEVRLASSQAGRNDLGTDPFPSNRLEILVGLAPRRDWSGDFQLTLANRLEARLRAEFPTLHFAFSQPISDSLNEDANGTSADLAIEFLGNDLDDLEGLARQAEGILREIPGAADVWIEQEGPQPQLVLQPDRLRAARFDVHLDEVSRMITTALGGEPVSAIQDAGRRFDIVVQFDRREASTPEGIGALPVYSQGKVPIPLSQVADLSFQDGRMHIFREGGRRAVAVRCDVAHGREEEFVNEARRQIRSAMRLPQGVETRWIGAFDRLAQVRGEFVRMVPATAAAVGLLLIVGLRSWRAGLAVLPVIPFSLLSGVVGLWGRGMPLDGSAGVALVVLCGTSVVGGILQMEGTMRQMERGLIPEQAIIEGALARLRPILIVSLAAILGLVPAALGGGLGSEVQRPLATVLTWGMGGALAYTLFILPVMCRLCGGPVALRSIE
ncbi:MAG: efflux RND transporter permease subunit [Planctomycetales bacterium]